LTLNQEKRSHTQLLIDWKHQNLLKDESYFKLDQIKQLLFYPSCRKRFILEYFGDEEDLKNLKTNCGGCDYCADKKKFDAEGAVDYVHTSVFSLVLEVVNTYDERYGANLLSKFMRGSADKRLIEWNMHKKKNF
jgi:superfamily II DNA helicase RecQ